MRSHVCLLVGAALLCSALGSTALAAPLPPEERAKFRTDRLKAMLELSEAQTKQVAEINLEMARKLYALRTSPDHSKSRDEIEADGRDIKKDAETALHGVLS